jgi:hypothetical protein
MSTHLVYLAGPINGCTDGQCNDWRTLAKHELKCDTLDPMRRDYRGRELEPGIAAEIVRGDEQDIAASSIVLANCPKPSWGTAMELRMAKSELAKVVVIVVPDGAVISPWLVHHSDYVCRDLRDAITWINERIASGE